MTVRPPDSGSQTGSQQRQTSSDRWRPRATIDAARWHIRRQPATVRDRQIAPEKRKVGGSTPPLTTHSDQPRRPGGFLRPGRLTATVTATATFERAFGLVSALHSLASAWRFSSSAVCAHIVIGAVGLSALWASGGTAGLAGDRQDAAGLMDSGTGRQAVPAATRESDAPRSARTGKTVLLVPVIMSPRRDHRLGRAYGASHAMAQAPPQTPIFHGKTRRLSGGRGTFDSLGQQYFLLIRSVGG
jgi:hypothetical protein